MSVTEAKRQNASIMSLHLMEGGIKMILVKAIVALLMVDIAILILLEVMKK